MKEFNGSMAEAVQKWRHGFPCLFKGDYERSVAWEIRVRAGAHLRRPLSLQRRGPMAAMAGLFTSTNKNCDFFFS